METPGAVPMTEQAVWGVGSAGKPRAPSQKPVLSGLAVASDPIGFWEGVGPDCAVATPLLPVTDNVGRAKKKKHHHHRHRHRHQDRLDARLKATQHHHRTDSSHLSSIR